ncbi:hypothetical protein DXG03_002728 [Asterophora parasitica]|uniref:Uncharacterized protein n=1 Tax=Asterophora parasitica TaxID=117018 RepID=A0A9P7K9P4_9AGAR|nr:hypothetical protein DXG03_002728 [Asterophora parasitica]
MPSQLLRLPEDLQRLIFEIAARADTPTARHLVLVASHVRKWIDPILYSCVIVRTQADAALLLSTLPSKLTPSATHLYPQIKPTALALGASLTLTQSKALLSLLSAHLSDLAVWGGPGRNPTIFLPFVKSTTATAGNGSGAGLRRLALRSQHPCELNFPPSLLSGLTHLMILDGPYTWFQMREASRRHTLAKSQSNASSHKPLPASTSTSTPSTLSPPSPPHSNSNSSTHQRLGLPSDDPPDPTPTPTLFTSLTHFAVCTQNWGSTHALLRRAVAPHLTHFVVVLSVSPSRSHPSSSHSHATIAQRIEELGDRRVVLVEHEMSVESWREGVGGGEGGLWARAERLVRDGYFAEGGLGGEVRRWPAE